MRSATTSPDANVSAAIVSIAAPHSRYDQAFAPDTIRPGAGEELADAPDPRIDRG